MEVGEHVLPAFNLNNGRDVPDYSFSAISASSEDAPKVELTAQMALNGGEREYSAAPPSAAAGLDRCPSDVAAMKVQKHYRSYRTRRMLADSAVVAEELWRQALDFAKLNYSTVSFFNLKPETVAARWSRTGLNASKVGKGLSKDAKAKKLAFEHWIEAIDPRHRYGHSLHLYYQEWCKTETGQPFFYWLDLGDGRFFDHEECRRSRLLQECIEYLGPIERQHYVYEVVDGRLLNKLSGKPLNTTESSPRSKWIFVMCTSKRLYIGEKTKGRFHHSSFLAGGATLAAGKLMAEDGVLKAISPYSGHYKPTDDILEGFLSYLKENGVNLDQVKILKANEGYETTEKGDSSLHAVNSEASISDSFPSDPPTELETLPSETTNFSKPENGTEYKRSLSGGLQSPRPDVPRKALLERINSKKAPIKWSTGAGPRIGCISDYPLELRLQAMELTLLSPKTSPQLSTPGRAQARMVSPSAYPSNGTNDEHEAYFKV